VKDPGEVRYAFTNTLIGMFLPRKDYRSHLSAQGSYDHIIKKKYRAIAEDSISKPGQKFISAS
jgi:hypothetical protein